VETVTMTLVEFLEARLDEDEAVARAAIPTLGRAKHELPDGPPYFEWVQVPGDGVWRADYRTVEGIGFEIYDEGGHGDEEAAHIARHDPARVLREVEAKRAILAEHERVGETCETCSDTYHGFDCEGWEEPYPCPTLRALAAVYADHPDYHAEWR